MSTNILKGKNLIRSCIKGDRDISPNYMDENRWWYMDSYKNISSILAGDIWFFYRQDSKTHFDLVCSIKAHLINAIKNKNIDNIKKILEHDNIVMCLNSEITISKTNSILNDLDTFKRQNTYNCRYFQDYECLVFWGPFDDVDLGLVGELIDHLNIFSKDLTICFANYNSYCGGEKKKVKIELASRLHLGVKTNTKATSPLKNLSSLTLHTIACKKPPLPLCQNFGFGSSKLKGGLSVSQYNMIRYHGD